MQSSDLIKNEILLIIKSYWPVRERLLLQIRSFIFNEYLFKQIVSYFIFEMLIEELTFLFFVGSNSAKLQIPLISVQRYRIVQTCFLKLVPIFLLTQESPHQTWRRSCPRSALLSFP